MTHSAPFHSTLSASSVRAMAERIAGRVICTPTLFNEDLARLTGAHIFIKFENLQHTGAFKARGAAACLLGLSPAQRTAGVIAMSAGNHAQGVAFFAAKLGIPSTVVMPRNTPFLKARRTEGYGAKVILEGETLNDSAALAQDIAGREKLTFVHPYNDDDVIAGQGTVALEMLAQVPDLDVLVVPVGGGGLIAGCALIAKDIKPGIEVIGVQTALYPSAINAVRGLNLPCGGTTIAEGIAVTTPGSKTIPLIKQHVDDVVAVSEAAIERCIAIFAASAKTLVEGAGAASLAAVLQHPERFAGRKVGLVLSGGNIDSRMMSSVLMRDLQRNGQVLTLGIEMPDKPGQLHAVSGICAGLGANVLEVSHNRF
ncbi:MAG: threonine ammonia-lyase, partial [Rhodospirillaceae bacterium]